MWCFGGKWIWIWCSADNNMSIWWIVLRSGSKIRLKKSIFSQISCGQITFQQQAIYEKCFIEIIIHMDAYYKEYHILFVTMASTLDYQDGQSWYVWRKMPSLTAVNVAFFLEDIPHLNYQQKLENVLIPKSILEEDMLLGTMISILDFQNGNLLWIILQIGNFLRYSRDILYISLCKVQWAMCPWPLN